MNISTERNGGELKINMCGDLDHHAARYAIPRINQLIDIELPINVKFDFKKISFMDSSGIALIISAYKRTKSIGGEFEVINVSKQAYKVFDAAGICKLMNINEYEFTSIK